MKKILVAVFAICLSFSMLQAQEKEKTIEGEPNLDKLLVKVKDGAKPDIYVDGKKFDFPVELIDQKKIESVFVIKDAEQLKKYKSPNGVILITTKVGESSDGKSKEKIKVKAKDKKKHFPVDVSHGPNLKELSELAPMVIIDGKVSNKKALEKLSPDSIESIDVIKGEKAEKKYNAPHGVIIIKTK